MANIFGRLSRESEEDRRTITPINTQATRTISPMDRPTVQPFIGIQPQDKGIRPRSAEGYQYDIEWTRDQDWRDMGTLSRIFDVLRRGQFASANVMRAILEGEGDLAQAAWDGLTGREKGNYIDIMRHYDVPYAPLIGTAMNIGLDPIKYLGGPIGIFKSMAKTQGVTAATKHVSDLLHGVVPKIGKVGTPVEWLGRAFDPDYKIHPILSIKAWMEHYGFKTDLGWAMKDVQTRIGDITPQMKKLMTQWRLDGTIPKNPEDLELLGKAMRLYEEASQRALQFGLISKDKFKDMAEGYLPTVLSKNIEDWTGAKTLFSGLDIPSFAKKKEFQDLGIREWRRISADFHDLSRMGSVEQILRAAKKKVELAGPFDEEFSMSYVKKAISAHEGDLTAIQARLHEISMDFMPVDEFDKLFAMTTAELAQAQHQDNLIQFALEKSKHADNWRRKLSPADTNIPDGWLPAVRLNKLQRALDRIPDEAKTDFHKRLSKKVLTPARTEGILKGKFMDLQDVEDWVARGIANDSLLRDKVTAYALDSEVMDYFTRMEGMFTPDHMGGKLAKMFDKMLGIWKKSATIWRMPFHLRNFMTNKARMYQGGMGPGDIYTYGKKALEIQRAKGDQIVDVTGVKKTADEWMRLMSSKGVRGWGWVGEMDAADIIPGAPKEVGLRDKYLGIIDRILEGKASKSDWRELLSAPSDVGGWVGHTIEDNDRISATLWATVKASKEKGIPFMEALDEGAVFSWKHLFQYDQLTHLESKFFKRLMPFYTWNRKNVELQATKLFTDPVPTKELYQAVDMFRYLNPETPREQEFVPEYIQELGFFRLPDMIVENFSNQEGPVYANIDMPWDDLHNIADHPVRTFLSSLNPLFSMLGLGMGVENFPVVGRPIERFKGELVPVPAAATFLPDIVQGVLGMTDMIHPETGKEVLGMPGKAVQALYDLLPPLREFNNMFPQDGVELERAGQSPWAKLRYVTGLQFRPVDYAEQQIYQRIERQQRLSDVARRMSQLGRPLTTEELEEYLN